MGVINKGELAEATTTWRQAYFRAVMSGSLQLPNTNSNGTGVKGGDPFLPEVLPEGVLLTMSGAQFTLHGGLPFSHLVLSGNTGIPVSGTLYAGSHAGGDNIRPPVAYISGANCDHQGIHPGSSGTHLFAKLKHLFHQNPC